VRGAWLFFIVGLSGLVSLRVAYDLTYEPPPSVRVRWRDFTTDARRAQLERQYRLTDPVAPEGLSYAYLLMDTSRRNIEALVKDPEVADTNDIDRRKFEIPWTTAQARNRYTWVAERIPGLRQPIVRWAVVSILAAMAAYGLVRLVAAVAWVRCARSVVAWMRRVDWMLKHG